MEGAALAAKRRHDAQTSLAWHTAVFAIRAYSGKLEKLGTYLGIKPKPQTPDEMLAVLRGMNARGAPMKITVN